MTTTATGLTRIARDFMLSEQPSRAWRLIANGLQDEDGRGGAERYASAILDGKKKLIGNESRMTVVTDRTKGAKAYAETLHYIYAGRVRLGRAWYRPKAIVREFGPHDANFATARTRIKERALYGGFSRVLLNPGDFPEGYTITAQDLREWYAARMAFYAAEGDRVVAVRDPHGKTSLAKEAYPRLVIFEPVGEQPHWWEEHLTPADALKDFETVGRKLDELRWSDTFSQETAEDVQTKLDAEDTAREEEALRKEERRRARVAEEERLEQQEKEHVAECVKIRAEVLAKAGDDMVDLHTREGVKVATVPRAPFYKWALGRTSLRHLAPPWDPVSFPGMKMGGDDPYHTDWFFGATIHISETEEEKEHREAWGIGAEFHYDYHGPLSEAAFHEMFELQSRLGNFDAAVVVDAGEVYGEVGKDIVVLPDLQPDHVDKIVGARGIITQVGGRAAHIAQVALERNVTIMRVPDACTRYLVGTTLRLVPEEGKIDVDVKHKIPFSNDFE